MKNIHPNCKMTGKRKQPENNTPVPPEDVPKYTPFPKSREYNVLFVSITTPLDEVLPIFDPNDETRFRGITLSDQDCAVFVHTTHDKVVSTGTKLEQFGFGECSVWKILKKRNGDKARADGSGNNTAAPTASFVLLATKGKLTVSHNHLPYEIIGSSSDSEKIALDMAADLFAMDVRVYTTASPKVVRSGEYDTLVYHDIIHFLPHKPFTPSTARKCRIFSAWLQHSSVESLRHAKYDLALLLSRDNDQTVREHAWNRTFPFLPCPQNDDVLIDLARDERWVRRLRTRLQHLRRKAQRERGDAPIVVVPGDVAKKPKPATKGFAAKAPVSHELAAFIRRNFPEEVVDKNDDGVPMLARTRVVKLLSMYVRDNKLQNQETKVLYEIGRDEQLTELLKPETQTLKFLEMSKLLNPHFPKKQPASASAAVAAVASAAAAVVVA